MWGGPRAGLLFFFVEAVYLSPGILVVSIFFSIIPIYPQYIPDYNVVVSIFFSIIPIYPQYDKACKPSRALALNKSDMDSRKDWLLPLPYNS